MLPDAAVVLLPEINALRPQDCRHGVEKGYSWASSRAATEFVFCTVFGHLCRLGSRAPLLAVLSFDLAFRVPLAWLSG